MDNNKQKAVDTLNDLIEINNDRIEGYEKAQKETNESDLKNLFGQLKETSRKNKEELVSEVTKAGGKPKEGTATSGKIYRVWMDVKAALSKRDRKAILSSCEYGEDVAVKAYKDALANPSNGYGEMLKKQHDSIKADHDKVKQLRDSAMKS